MTNLQPHPAAELFPMMSDGDLAALAADIEAHGQRQPIIVHDGLILDGRHRYAACQKLGIQPLTVEWDGKGAPDDFVISVNLHRRHLNESQRAMIAARLVTLRLGDNQHTGGSANLQTRSHAEAAKALRVSERAVHHASTVQKKATPELVKAVDDGEIRASTAAQIVHLPKDRQREIASSGKKAAVKAAKQVKVRKQTNRVTPTLSNTPKETEHVKDLRFLEETWAATCESAHAAFLKKLGFELRAVA